MKTDKRQQINDILWLVLLIGLPIVTIGATNLSPNLRFWKGSVSEQIPSGLNPAYHYHFPQTLKGALSPKQALQQEIAFYQKKIALAPQSSLDRASLALAYLKMAGATGTGSWYLMAEQAAERSLSELPFNNDTAVIVLARVAEARHDFVTALQRAQQATGDDAIAIKVTSNLALGKVDEANKAAEALVNRIPTLGSLTLRAMVREAQGRDAEAIKDYQKALAAEEPGEVGSSAKTRTYLGRFYARRGQLAQAKALYEEALRLVPRYPLALVHLAELETRQKQYRAAEERYSQVSVYSQGAATVFDHIVDRGRARLRNLQGDAQGAKEWYDKAEALLRQETAVENVNGGFGHRRELARLLLERGRKADVEEALALMQEEVKIRRDAQTLDTLAWALSNSGRWQEARKVMAEALRWGVRDAAMFYRVGAIEKALGNLTQSEVYIRKATKVDSTLDAVTGEALGLDMEIFN
ncbi:tetratricopeptide repeat protein [Kamptonema animale CS-326]|jgi:tetratricopeptide (TPR) repeat protein|uniref:tetratricopeptide repeat protein n=1 Tax=Kamptonema animale TaxID=92934 RepID=UPI00232E503E|nr:tetratricopeptide repeat protein [Kamptonema animale]MDB9512447.1 tetratricopeptide repeat protein [Kamptonema animale CS-326]